MTSPPETDRPSPAPRPGQERDPELGALTVPDDGQFDEEYTTQFDWLGRPPQLWWDHERVIEYADRQFPKRIEEMLGADGRGRAVEAAVTLPIRMATPKIEPTEDDKGQAEFVEEALFSPVEDGGMRTPMSTFIGQVANALCIRRTFHEKVFTRREDGKIVYKKLAWRPPESCDVWRDPKSAEILGFRQYQYLDAQGKPTLQRVQGSEEDDPYYATVPAARSFIYTHGKHRDPLRGISDLDVALWAHDMKLKVVWLWHAFLDGQATPRMAVYGQDKTEVEKRARAMASLRGGGVAGFIRKGSDENVFDAIESAGTGATAFQEMIRWLDNVASESVMAGHLGLTGGATEGRGSLALSQDASGLYLASRQGVARELADEITAGIVAPLVRLNFGIGTSVPRFIFESVDTSKTAQIFEMFNTLSVAGSTQIPGEFILLLMDLVAQYLDLPADKVEAMIEEAEKAIQTGRENAAKMAEAAANGEVPVATDAKGKPVAGPGSPVGDKVDAATAVVKAAQKPPVK